MSQVVQYFFGEKCVLKSLGLRTEFHRCKIKKNLVWIKNTLLFFNLV